MGIEVIESHFVVLYEVHGRYYSAGFEVPWRNNFTATLGFAGQYGSTWDGETRYAKLQYAFD